MKKNKGITIIALVITIIVLLILAGVSIATLFGSNGIISQANRAKLATEEANAKEKLEVEVLGCYETNGKLSLEKLKGNIPNVGTVKNPETEDFPLKVDVDGYPFEITGVGQVSSVGTGGTGTSGSSGGTGGTTGGDTGLTSDEMQRLLNQTKKELEEKIQNLETQLAEEKASLEEKINQNVTDITNLTNWKRKELDIKMDVKAWKDNIISIPEIKNAKKVAFVINEQTFYAENTDIYNNINIPMSPYRRDSTDPYMLCGWIVVGFKAGEINIYLTGYGTEMEGQQFALNRIYYI